MRPDPAFDVVVPAIFAGLLGVPASPRFDLGAEPWIPVTTPRGARRVGLVEALEHAHEITSIAVEDPLERYSVRRYLLAVTYLAYALDPRAPWSGCNTSTPLAPAGVRAAIERLAPTWWLVHPTSPFAQVPELVELMTKPRPEGFSAVVAHLPSKSAESWWNRDVPDALELAAAPLVLLSRHFTALAGNEAGVLGKATSRCEGGVATSGPQTVTSVYLRSDTLAASLRANMVTSITNGLSSSSILFFEDPCHPLEHLDDPLYLYSASGCATLLLADGEEVSHVLRAALPVPSEQAKALMTAARLADPHVLRVRLSGEPPTRGLVPLSPRKPPIQNAATMYESCAEGISGLRSNVLDAANRLAPDVARGLGAMTITTTGDFTGARVEDVTCFELDPLLFGLSDTHAAAFSRAVRRLDGSVVGCLSLLRDALGRAIGSTPHRAASRARAEQLDAMLWSRLAAPVTQYFDSIASGADEPPDELPAPLKEEWIARTLEVFDEVASPLLASPSAATRCYASRAALGGALWKKL